MPQDPDKITNRAAELRRQSPKLSPLGAFQQAMREDQIACAPAVYSGAVKIVNRAGAPGAEPMQVVTGVSDQVLSAAQSLVAADPNLPLAEAIQRALVDSRECTSTTLDDGTVIDLPLADIEKRAEEIRDGCKYLSIATCLGMAVNEFKTNALWQQKL